VSEIIGSHGGYRELRAYQLSEIVYDGTVAFTGLYVERKSRTVDQMVQAARSGKQNIAEGSMASATSKKTELKLTSVARASLEELLLDYEDFLRQGRFAQWPKDHPKAQFIRKLRHDPRLFRKSDGSDLSDERRLTAYDTYRVYVEEKGPENAANTLICLTQQTTFLLHQLLKRLEADFVKNGGFTEKLYKTRKDFRDREG
jgi:four helix bundle suffix protein